jgi:hypothetical protein
MDNAVLNSTFLLTLLLLVGLFFFIRASIKDRIEQIRLLPKPSKESGLEQLQQYFAQRAYRVAAVDAAQQTVRWEGVVRPSWFLAIFLSGLAAVGGLCLALVLGMLFPEETPLFWGLALIGPLAGLFYWRGAGRAESVSLRVEPWPGATESEETGPGKETGPGQSVLVITGHRDELAALQRSLSFAVVEPDSEL